MVSAASKPHPYLPLILSFALFMQLLDGAILNNALPKMGESFAVAPLRMQWAIISYALTLAIFLPISGFLADRLGTKQVFLTAVVIFSLGSLLCACAPSLAMLVFARVIQGIGGAMMVPVARLVLTKTYPREELLGVMNIAVIPALIAPVVAPLLSGYLVEYASWHWVFLINLPIGVLGYFFGRRIVPDYRMVVDPFDFGGFLLIAAAMTFLTLALVLSSHPRVGGLPFLLGGLGAALIAVYTRYAKAVKNPLFPLSLFLVRTFRVGIIGSLFTRLGFSAIPLLMPLFFQLACSLSPITAGWMLVPLALGMLAIKPLVVTIIRRFSYRGVLVVNTAFIGILLIVFAWLDDRYPIAIFFPFLFLLGVFSALQFTAMNTLTFIDLRPAQRSSGNALMSVNQQFAIGMGIACGTAILNGFEERMGFPIGNAFQWTFAILGGITILSGSYFLRLGRDDGAGV